MKTIPKRLLRDTVSVETFSGTGAYGPVYAASANVLCKVSAVRQLVRDADGVEVISEFTVYVHPEDEAKFTPQSRVTVGGRLSTVLTVSPQARPGETVLIKVMCT